MKRWLPLLIALLMLLPGCFASSPEKTVTSFLDHLIQGNVKSAAKLTLSGSLTLDVGSKSAAAIYTPLLSSMQYSLGGSHIEGEYATVNLTLLTVDMEELMSQVSAQVVQQMLHNQTTASDDLFYSLLLEQLEAEDVVMGSYTVSVELVKDKGRWKVDMITSSDFAQAIGGGVKGLIVTS